jgi:hypothetical protein
MAHRLAWSVGAGVSIAAVYTLTPLTVCVSLVGAAVLPLLVRGLAADERRRVAAILALALATRLVVIGGIFLRQLPSHNDQFVGATTGDEAYSMSRALRTREILLGMPVTKYDFFVAFDEYGRNSFVTALTALELVFGPTPYAGRLLNVLLFFVGSLLLFRRARSAFGPLPASLGLAGLLFWPTLFFWSVSLLKEPLYFCLGAIVVSGAIEVARRREWLLRASAVVVVAGAAGAARDLRPGALPLMALGVALGLGACLVAMSRRALAVAALTAVIVVGVAASRPAVEASIIGGLESAAKIHTGHVFTVGHAYKLLDAGFYWNPGTPAASTLTLTPDEAARFVIRAATSFFVVPAPWQIESARELAYLPEQIAWYVLVLMLPAGVVAAWRRDRLTTAVLVGFAAPTAAALALTNGNVGTLLRLRGLVIPYLIWVGAVGFCAMVGSAGPARRKLNLVDAAAAIFLLALIPISYGTYLLFRTPAVRVTSVTRVPISREERRVAGGSRLSAKLKVRGSGLRPMLRATIGSAPALGFIFEDPNSADVLVGEVGAGTHDLVLYDGVQEVARSAKSVTIEAFAAPRIAGVGTLIHLDRTTADGLSPGAPPPGGPADRIVKLRPARQEAGGLLMRPAEIMLQCDPDPNAEGCAVGGAPLSVRPLPTVKLVGPSGAVLMFALTDVFPDAKPSSMTVTTRIAAPSEVLGRITVGDRDALLDDRAAVVVAVGGRRGGGTSVVDVTLSLGCDDDVDGCQYRGRVVKAGALLQLTTDSYAVEGTVLSAARGTR